MGDGRASPWSGDRSTNQGKGSLCALHELSEGLIIGTCNGNRVLIEERVRSRRAKMN